MHGQQNIKKAQYLEKIDFREKLHTIAYQLVKGVKSVVRSW
jgi:hypothetical protein